MLKVGIVGVSGYTGAELVRLLAKHPQVDISVVTSRQYAGQPLDVIYPHLQNIVDCICEDVNPAKLADRADFFFTAVPHKTAMEIVPTFLNAGKKVVDLSADFRIHDPVVYEQWYQTHIAQEFLSEAVYGLPERYRQQVSSARLVANPGCYPTSIILGLAPLIDNGLIDPLSIIADSKSGASGAGRSAQVGTLYCEVTDGFRAYKIGEHRHTPEIEQELSSIGDREITISFTPHLIPMSRGILSTIYAKLVDGVDCKQVNSAFQSCYENETFVRVVKEGTVPATQYVRGSNFCDIGFKVDPRTGRIVVVSVIDNLVKGAAGQAVQNMNIMNGFDETDGLLGVPMFP